MPEAESTAPVRRGRVLQRTLWSIGAVLLAVVVIAALLASWTVQRSFPRYSGAVDVPGLSAEVTVQRDDAGIPTIIAETSEDLLFAQGYVHAQDRFWEMDFRRHVTAGRVAELFGASQVDTDAFLRTLGWHAIAETEVEAMEPDIRSYYESYAEGVNAYLAEHSGGDLSLEYAVLGLQNPGYEPEPWTPVDSVAWLKAMAWDLRTNIEDETTRALMAPSFTPEELAQLYPGYPFGVNPTIVPQDGVATPKTPATGADADTDTDAAAETEDADAAGATDQTLTVPVVADGTIEWTEVSGVLAAVEALVGDTGEGVGSNSWVVSGSVTDTGMPLLANDPHLGAALPSVWHQVSLRCETVSDACPFNVSGFSFSGLPGIVIGHNDRIAWGFTNLTTDVSDLYIERLQGDQYWRDGVLVPLETRQETIAVAGGEDVELEIRSTVHGPIVSDLTDDFGTIAETTTFAGAPEGDAYAVSLQWTALRQSSTSTAIFRLNLAQNIEDFRAAAAVFDVPAQNLVYADVEGNIAYQQPGYLPIRGSGDGTVPQPGWLSAYDWQGAIPFEDLAWVLNPSQGYIVTANNAIVDDSYAYFLSKDWDYGYRAARITELLEHQIATGKVTAEAMANIQNDKQFFIGAELATIVSELPLSGTGATAAVDLLTTWDGQNDADSPAAAYANVLWDTLATAIYAERGVITDGQSRLFRVTDLLLTDPESPWWTDPESGATGRDAVLTAVAERAYDRIEALQGEDVNAWRWGTLHALTLRSDTFGSSGIAPIEALFNRGPYPVGGGASVVDATGWPLGGDFATTTVPSMRMVIDVANFDASTWIHLTGTSGHAFHPNYTDQTADWAAGRQRDWAYSPDAVTAATTDTLVLRAAS